MPDGIPTGYSSQPLDIVGATAPAFQSFVDQQLKNIAEKRISASSKQKRVLEALSPSSIELVGDDLQKHYLDRFNEAKEKAAKIVGQTGGNLSEHQTLQIEKSLKNLEKDRKKSSLMEAQLIEAQNKIISNRTSLINYEDAASELSDLQAAVSRGEFPEAELSTLIMRHTKQPTYIEKFMADKRNQNLATKYMRTTADIIDGKEVKTTTQDRDSLLKDVSNRVNEDPFLRNVSQEDKRAIANEIVNFYTTKKTTESIRSKGLGKETTPLQKGIGELSYAGEKVEEIAKFPNPVKTYYKGTGVSGGKEILIDGDVMTTGAVIRDNQLYGVSQISGGGAERDGEIIYRHPNDKDKTKKEQISGGFTESSLKANDNQNAIDIIRVDAKVGKEDVKNVVVKRVGDKLEVSADVVDIPTEIIKPIQNIFKSIFGGEKEMTTKQAVNEIEDRFKAGEISERQKTLALNKVKDVKVRKVKISLPIITDPKEKKEVLIKIEPNSVLIDKNILDNYSINGQVFRKFVNKFSGKQVDKTIKGDVNILESF